MSFTVCHSSAIRLSGGSASNRATPVPLLDSFRDLIGGFIAAFPPRPSVGYIDAGAEVLIRGQLERFETQFVQGQIRDLSKLDDNWDENGSLAPSSKAISSALSLISQFYTATTQLGLEWINPHVSVGEEGEVMLEWRKKRRKLTVYASDGLIEFVKVWGPHVLNEMSTGTVESYPQLRAIWGWLSDQ